MNKAMGLALLVLLVSGCATTAHRDAVSALPPQHELQPLPVAEDWQQYVLESYQNVVRANIVSPATAQFEQPPRVTAAYDQTANRTNLTAVGPVDAQNRFGALLRGTFIIMWTRPGDGSDPGRKWVCSACVVMGP